MLSWQLPHENIRTTLLRFYRLIEGKKNKQTKKKGRKKKGNYTVGAHQLWFTSLSSGQIPVSGALSYKHSLSGSLKPALSTLLLPLLSGGVCSPRGPWGLSYPPHKHQPRGVHRPLKVLEKDNFLPWSLDSIPFRETGNGKLRSHT